MPSLPGDIYFFQFQKEIGKQDASGAAARSQELTYCLGIESLDSYFWASLDQLLSCALPSTSCVTSSK